MFMLIKIYNFEILHPKDVLYNKLINKYPKHFFFVDQLKMKI